MTKKTIWKKLLVVATVMAVVLLCSTAVFAEDTEPEERVDGEYEIVTDQSTGELTLIYHVGWYGDGYGAFFSYNDSRKSQTHSVVADDGTHFAGSCNRLFYAFDHLESVNLSNVDTAEVVDMSSMFYGTDRRRSKYIPEP